MIFMIFIATLAASNANRLSEIPSNTTPLTEQIAFTRVCRIGIREDNTDYIDCSNRELENVPNFFGSNFCDVLNLSSNKLRQIPIEAFKDLRISKLLLMDNPIQQIHPRAFHLMKQTLEELVISFDGTNRIKSIPRAILENLQDLTVLKLSGLSIQKIPLGITSFKRLSQMSFIDCDLSDISMLFSMSDRVMQLDLTNNKINTLELSFMVNLVHLTLDQNRINSISVNSLPRSNLRTFSCKQNNLRVIDHRSFEGVPLKSLDLSQNNLKSNTLHFLKELSNLENLDLSHNQIDRFPKDIFSQCKGLTLLRMDDNRISSLDSSSFFGMKKIRTLTMSNNNICFILSGSLSTLEELQTLDLSNNPLNLINDIFFVGIEKSLLNFNLRGIGLKFMENLKLDKFEKLETLQLADNLLRSVNFSVLCSLGNLKTVHLERNHLSTVPSIPIGCNVKHLFLSGNPISVLPNLYSYRSLLSLSIDSIQCDCDSIDHHRLHQIPRNRPGWNVTCKHSNVSLKHLTCPTHNRGFMRRLTSMNVIPIKNSSALLVSWNVTAPDQVLNFTISYKMKHADVNGVTSSVSLKANARAYIISHVKVMNYYSVCLRAWFINPSQKDTFCRDITFPVDVLGRNEILHTQKRLLILGLIILILFAISLVLVLMLLDDHRRHKQLHKQRDERLLYTGKLLRSDSTINLTESTRLDSSKSFQPPNHVYQEVICHNENNLFCQSLQANYRTGKPYW